MPDSELEKWLALQDHYITFSAADPEMGANDVNTVALRFAERCW